MAPLLSDVLTPRSRSTTTFSSALLRSADLAQLISDPESRLTVLAPLNSALDALPCKIWELDETAATATTTTDTSSSPAADIFAGEEGRARADRNEAAFVRRHLVRAHPWSEGAIATTVAGAEASWTQGDDGKRVIQPWGIRVVSVEATAANGEMWIIDGVVGAEGSSESGQKGGA